MNTRNRGFEPLCDILPGTMEELGKQNTAAYTFATGPTAKAIPTLYRGTTFRSRLEARYAAAFDQLKIQWAYETEGYTIDGVQYLPDFYLPEMRVFVEVKGPLVPGEEKAIALAKVFEASYQDDEITTKNTWWNPAQMILVGNALGELTNPLRPEELNHPIGRCRACKKRFIFCQVRSFQCRICGEHDGDHHLEEWEDSIVLPQMQYVRKASQ